MIACGGTACLAALALIPMARHVQDSPVPLLSLMIGPLLNTVLLILVIGQVVLGQRQGWRIQVRVIAGCL